MQTATKPLEEIRKSPLFGMAKQSSESEQQYRERVQQEQNLRNHEDHKKTNHHETHKTHHAPPGQHAKKHT